MKQRIRDLFEKANLAPSRKAPFLSRRYPYGGARRMHSALGPDLAAPTTWRAADTPPAGELGAIFMHTGGANKWLHYLPVYEANIDRSQPIRMLELGVFRGGSLRMWREYLHPQSVIVGIDIDPNCKQFEDPEHNVHVRIGGQQDATFLQEVNSEFGPFDVILDDGSHMTSHMVESFRNLFASALAEPGAYIVEDVHSNYWKPYRDSSMSFVDFVAVLVDAMHAHYPDAESEVNFRTDDPARLREVSVPRITPKLDGIEIHDSIVVVRKASRDLPRSVYQ
ncbi:class I SAM-dependent methyltransferase [Mycolicibacterium sp. CAU 1645]|uniref:Class I SAM-dependent methyltransferase n=2 Tax=Mycolicibacterium arenosum TaxID=2952157 RepID=A0ABT1M825_9MYCO|nr:class I SAM-dependent methyltransferase [Mycolicibacterium sp. CAU 1645]MCP9275301.1 class I SAM-dependent methyltransferase [Mycolicibacterium sp. CAU 1645]